ncbi:hypothetical protein CHUAL_001444 [Chamberlinius hualienensis]
MMSSSSTSNSRPTRTAREKAHKSTPDHNKTTDGTPSKIQPTAEQIRLAQMINDTKDMDDPDLQTKIRQLVELTGKTVDEVSVALHDCDNDINRAGDMLIEGKKPQGVWETSMKRKKVRPTAVSTTVEDVPNQPAVNNKENKPRSDKAKEKPVKDRDNNRNRMPPRMSRGKGRDSDKNDKNLEDGQPAEQNFERRGRGARMMNGPGRGRGRGGRVRTFQSRGSSHLDFPRSIDTWTNASADEGTREEDRLRVGNWSDGFPAAEEWDNEDWTGSLAETKVFTPSATITNTDFQSSSNKHQPSGPLEVSSLGLGLDVSNVTQSTAPLETVKYDQNIKPMSYSQASDVVSSTSSQPLGFNLGVAGTASENSAYSISSITSSQSVSGTNVHEGTLGSSPLSITSMAVAGGSSRSSSLTMSSANHPSHMVIPSRSKSQRPRGLGASKIPASAVEMPDDAITTLDVQFGNLEFGSESPKLNLSSLLEGSGIQSTTESNRSSAISNHVNLSTSNSQVLSSSSTTSSSLHMPTLVKSSSDLDSIDQNSRISYTPQTTLVVSKDSSVSTVSQTNSSQVLSGSDMMSLSNVGTNKSSYALQRSSRPSTLDGTVSGTKPSDSLATYSVTPSYQVNYGNSKSSVSSYSNSSHPTLTMASSQAQSMSLYGPTSNQAVAISTSGYGASSQVQQLAYQSYSNPAITSGQLASGVSNSQSVYGHSSLNMSSLSGTKLSGNINSSSVKDVPDSTSQHVYDSSNNLTSGLTTSSVASSLGLSGTSFTSANSTGGKSASTKNFDQSKAGMTSMPPGVPAVLSHPYIVGQHGVPFYPVYSYEEIQMLPGRMPMSNFYDMSFQPSTSMTGRDTGGLSSLAYSGTDGKFSRGESSSPVPTSSLPQQSTTQQHQQTFISPTALPPGYGYYYSGGVVTGGFAQYGPQLFPVATATNTHGATSNTHFQKPNAYGSHGFSSAYDSLSQNQDYTKTTYGSGTQSQAKGVSGGHLSLQGGLGTVNSMNTNDMSGSVYSKGHAQMNKSFDKPGFPTGTPPPFNIATNQSAALGGPSTSYTAPTFISMMAHNPSPMIHHQMHQDSTSVSQRPSVNPAQTKSSSTSKQGYGPASYWTST